MKDLAEKTNEASAMINSSASCIDLEESMGTALECMAGNFDSREDYNIIYRIGSGSVEKFVKLLVNNISERYVSTVSKMQRKADDDSSSDVFNCDICTGILCEPVTIPCGHTYCRKCLLSDLSRKCKRCGLRFPLTSSLKVNVIIGNLLEKWCFLRIKATRLRHEGNDLFHRRLWEDAIGKYVQASEIYSEDHTLQSCQSRALLQLGYAEKALRHAERAIQSKPLWSEGYYRKAAALQSLGQYEEAIVAYLQSLVLAPDVAYIQSELSKLLHKTLNIGLARRNSQDKRFSPYAVPFRNCHSSPNSSCDSDDCDTAEESSKTCRKPIKRRPVFSSCSISSDKVYREETIQVFQNPYLNQLIDQCVLGINKMKKLARPSDSPIFDASLIDKSDFDCTLCYRIFWQPVTTPCGHVFCRMCLDRCLDHKPLCPLCKTSLQDYLAERRQSVTAFIEAAIKHYLPKDYNERQRIHEEEMAELASVGIDAQHEVPIFVCTMAFPTVPCPLHVFEPRYRLLIRQSIESGAKQFGMCPCFDESENGFAEFGTMVEIREVQYFPDGRAVVDTIGNKRFKVVRKGMRDGYNTASVEFLTDIPIEEADIEEIKTLHDLVHQAVFEWFDHLQDNVQQRILDHFGTMPLLESNWLSLPNGPSWCWWVLAILPLDKRAQLSILAMTSLKKRLEAIHRVLNYLQNRSII